MSRFKILWIDDQKDKCRREIISVKKIISSFGYEPDIVVEDEISVQSLTDTNGRLFREISARDVDLFIIDYNLKNDLFGDDVVEQIRKGHNIYTDIVFYSSVAKSLLDPVKNSFNSDSIMKFFDGVYIAPLCDEFLEKISFVIQKIIKSWYNIHSIRGIVLSKASKFEQMANEIIQEYSPLCLQQIKSALSEKGNNVCKNTKRKWDQINMEDDPIPRIINDPIGFNWAVKEKIIDTMIDNGALHMDKWEEIKSIFDLRNQLAHNPIHLVDGDLIVSTKSKGKTKNISITEEDVDRIRLQLTEAETNLEQLIHKNEEEKVVVGG